MRSRYEDSQRVLWHMQDACYFLCLLSIAEEYLDEKVDLLDAARHCMEQGWMKSDFFISGDETSVDAALSFGSCNVVWCKDSSDAKSCHLRIVKKYPAELQGRFDEDDAKTTKSVETFPASKWDVQVESVY